MKVSHKSINGRVEITAQGATHKSVFQELANMQEVFEEPCCKVCGNEDIRFVVRHVMVEKKKYEYYELHCNDFKCKARLAFGQNLEGGSLFPKRKDEDGNYLQNGGWSKWEGKKE